MGNKSNENQSLSSLELTKFLLLYEPVCDSYDQNLGKLKIFRKKVFCYDYIAVTSKLVQRYFVDDCKNMIKLCSNDNKVYANTKNINKQRILGNAERWLKVYSCQISQTPNNNQNLVPIKICTEFLTFTLKQYISNNSLTLLSFNEQKRQKSIFPTYLAYILACVLDAYNDLRNVHECHPIMGILSMIASITTPHLIYISLDGQLKFLTVPLFMYSDNLSKIDQWYEKRKDHSLIVTKYGTTATCVLSRNQGIQKLDKQFLNKFKKMVKQIRTEAELPIKGKEKQQSFLAITTEENRNNNAEGQFTQTYQKLVEIRKPTTNRQCVKYQQQSYWDLIQNANSILEIIRLIQSTNRLPQNLELPVFTGPFLESAKKREPLYRHDKIEEKTKLRKLSDPLNPSNNNGRSTNNANNYQFKPTGNTNHYQTTKNPQNKPNRPPSQYEQPKPLNTSNPQLISMKAVQEPQDLNFSFASNNREKNSMKMMSRKTKKKDMKGGEQDNWFRVMPNHQI